MKDARRLLLTAIALFLLLTSLIVQFYRIQILEGQKWHKQAKAQHETIIHEPFKRGVFYSNGEVKKSHPQKAQALALDILKYHLDIDPEMIPQTHKKEISSQISSMMNLDSAQKEKLMQQFHKKTRYRRVLMWISPEIKQHLQQWWNPYAKKNKIPRNAIYFVKDYKRSYPFGKMLGQLLHTVRDDKEIKSQKRAPTGGLEVYFNEYLQGKMGCRKILRSPRNPLEFGEVLSQPQNGADVYLTIEHNIQAIAEEEIEKAVKQADAKGGYAILMDPHTGEIFALAQYPFFDPSQYRKFYNDSSLIEHTKLKAVIGSYEMGSIIKPITATLALLANQERQSANATSIFNPEEKISLLHPYFPGRKKPVKDVGFNKFMNMNMAIYKSSNIYMAYLIDRIISIMGADWYCEKMGEIWGFGRKTGIEYPYENPGFFPSPKAKYATGSLQWSGPTPYSLAMGYNFLCSPLQMVRAYAVIANGGLEVSPTILKKIVREGEVIVDHTPLQSKKRLLPKIVCDRITNALRYTTKQGGTASRADVYGYSEAAKTGSAEKIKDGKYAFKYHLSSAIGFVPAKQPQFVLLVTIDEPEYRVVPGVGRMHLGGICAAPAFREIASRTLQFLGIEPDDPHGYPKNDPRYDPEKADWVKETRELIKLHQTWNR